MNIWTKGKNNRVLRNGLMLVTAMALAAPTIVAAAEEKVTITPYVGWVFGGSVSTFEGELKMADSENYGFNVDIPLKGSSTTKIRLSYTTYETAVTGRYYGGNNTINLFDMDVDYYQLGGIKTFGSGKFETYGMGTLGMTHFSPKNVADSTISWSSETLFSMTFGMGMNMMLTQRIGLNLQGRLLLPINTYGGGVFCGGGTGGGGCSIGVSGGSSMLQADITAGLVMRF